MKSLETNEAKQNGNIEAELDELKAFLSPFGKPEQENFLRIFRDIDNWTDIVLPDQKAENQADMEFPEYAPIRQIFHDLSGREKALLALNQSLICADNCTNDARAKHLRSIQEEAIERCQEDIKSLVDNQEFGTIALLAGVIEGLTN